MCRKTVASYVILLAIFSYMLFLNQMIPLSFGDDYVYRYVWDGSTGWNMFHPLEDNAQLVQSWSDIVRSQWSHYFTWGGRTVAHTMAQFVLWQGKWLFDILDAGFTVLLVVLIHWLSTGGEVTWRLKPSRLLFIFVCLWAFLPSFSTTFLWVLGACNYLWTACIVLAFLLPYVRHYFRDQGNESPAWRTALMMPCGVIAGWTNENTVCWFILVLLLYCIHCYRQKRLAAWMVSGLVGMMIGYAFLIFAPGNMVRKEAELQMGLVTGWLFLKQACLNLFVLLVFSFLLLHFIEKGLYRKAYFGIICQAEKRLRLIHISLGMFAGIAGIMFLSPDFPQRSLFGSTIFLIIAASLMVELIQVTGRNQLDLSVRRFLTGVAVLYMVITMSATAYGYDEMQQMHAENEQSIQQAYAEGCPELLEVQNVKIPFYLTLLSGFHLAPTSLSEDESNWMNEDYAKYRNLAPIRAISSGNDR